jgi:DNA-binding response OmpR family regulator
MSCALLIADPEPSTGGFLARHLSEDGFDVLRAEDGEDALSLAERARPDLVLLGGELDVCRRLREGEPGRSWNRDVPVIVLGPEEADAVDRVRAFDRGADDFVARPFLYDELLARIRAVLRRVAPPPGMVIEAGELVIDRSTRCVTVAGCLLALPVKQFDLLAKLASDPTRVFSKDELLKDVWGYRSIGRTQHKHPIAPDGRFHAARRRSPLIMKGCWSTGRKPEIPG